MLLGARAGLVRRCRQPLTTEKMYFRVTIYLGARRGEAFSERILASLRRVMRMCVLPRHEG